MEISHNYNLSNDTDNGAISQTNSPFTPTKNFNKVSCTEWKSATKTYKKTKLYMESK